MLRFISSNRSIENAGGASNFGSTELNAVSWNGDGSWAYIGGEGGWIWRFRGLEGGGVEAIPLENRGESDINSISCLRGYNICIVSSSVDGIGVINQEHELFKKSPIRYFSSELNSCRGSKFFTFPLSIN